MRTRVGPYLLLVAILVASSLAVTGCGTMEQAEAGFEPTPGIVHIGTPVEILVDESVGCLGHPAAESDMLIASARLDGEVHRAVVNLATGEAHRLNIDGIRVPSGPIRYVAQVRDVEPRSNLTELLVYDLLEGKMLTVAEGQLRRPHISGDTLVWDEYRGDGRNIYGYDLSEEQQFTVAEGPGVRTYPHVAGDWVVYLFWDAEEQPVDALRAHHIPSGEDVLIGTLTMGLMEHDPTALFDVSGSRVVWRVRGNEIHVYDLETQTDETVFEDERSYMALGSLDMAGDLVMWSSGPQEVTGYDLVHHQLFEIPHVPEEMRGQTSSKTVVLSENYVVWLVSEIDPRIWLLMTPPPPGAPTPTRPALVEEEECRRRLFVAPIIRQ